MELLLKTDFVHLQNKVIVNFYISTTKKESTSPASQLGFESLALIVILLEAKLPNKSVTCYPSSRT